jgi:DNA-binding Lrp family transcriptional regulator
MEDWWAETDNAILQCLRERGAMSPVELAGRLGLSPGESSALVCLLAAQGKVKVRLVELAEDDATLSVPARARRGRSRVLTRSG